MVEDNHQQEELELVTQLEDDLETIRSFPLPLKSISSKYFVNSKNEYHYPVSHCLLSFSRTELNNNARRSWAIEDEIRLNSMAETMKENGESIDWSKIAEQLNKTPADCFSHYHNVTDKAINKQDWTAEEEKNLIRIAEKYHYRNWHLIACELGSRRTPVACLKHYQQTLNSELINSAEWTLEEDNLLKEGIERYGVGKWQHISSNIPGRSAAQCLNRYRKSFHCQENIVSGAWTDQEERALFLASYAHDVPMLNDTKFGVEERLAFLESSTANAPEKPKRSNPNWTNISKFVPGKNDVQCREKWGNNLDPSLNTADFTAEEDEILRALVEKCGEGSWAKVASFLEGRTDSAVRSRWKFLTSGVKQARPRTAIEKRKSLPNKHLRSTKAKLEPTEFVPTKVLEIHNINK